MNFENIILEKQDKIAIISINRPQSLNALNKPLFSDLEQALTNLSQDPNIRAIVLTGTGEKSFVAGADIKEFMNFNVEQAENLSRDNQNAIFDTIENFNKPIIAAINGFALGGGLELAMACHIRYASMNAKLGLPEVTLGLIPGYGGTQRLPKLVGKGIANEMIFTAKMINAEKAKEIGLVNEVFPIEDLMTKTIELALSITKNSPLAIEKAIQAVNLSDDPKAGYEKEIKNFGELFGLRDKEEGVAAFLEKRKPNFQ